MDENRLQDRIYWGLNRAARIIGTETLAYRPATNSRPLSKENRFLRLSAAFSRSDGKFDQSQPYGNAVWRGYFDAAYTHVGDYLVQGDDIWFIISQYRLLPVLCIKTNKRLSVFRANIPTTGSPYDAAVPNTTTPILIDWPASMLGIDPKGRPSAGLPTDTNIPTSTVLLPHMRDLQIRRSDTIYDELGTLSIVVEAELSDFGWRLSTRQATT